MTEMVSPLPQSRRLRDRLLLAGLLALVGLGLVGLAAKTGWDETLAQIGKLGFGQIVVLLGLSLVNYVFRGLRWHLLARRLGLETGLLQDMRHFLGGFAMSVTPGRVGELVRMRWLRREKPDVIISPDVPVVNQILTDDGWRIPRDIGRC